MQRSALCRSRRELSVSPHVPFLNLLFEKIAYSNEYLLAKIGVDTAENEPLKVLRKIHENSIHYSFASLEPATHRALRGTSRFVFSELRSYL